MAEQNGHPPDGRWARFGPQPTQVLHPQTADELLTLWRERFPIQFGSLLAEVLTGQRFGARRERKERKS